MKGKQFPEKNRPKRPPRSKITEHSEEKKELLKILKGIIEDIDENGLVFLIKQAKILLRNIKMDYINGEVQKLMSTDEEDSVDPHKHKHEMEIIETGDSGSFIFVINKTRKMFSLDEMKKIVKICRSAENENDAVKRLYKWFSDNRSDALYDISIKNARDPALGTIYNHIINTYTLKE